MSLVEPEKYIKLEHNEAIKQEATNIEKVDEVTIKTEPLLENESCGNVIKTEKHEKQIFTCFQCSEFFEYIELYELHTWLHNENDTQLKHCPCCKKQYKRMDKFSLHIKEHLKKYYCCTFCNQICFSQNVLIRHISEHKKNGALACPYCGKTFTVQKSLTMHIRVHTNERPYECDICCNRFKQPSSLRTHKELIHSQGKPQECEVCHGKFCTKSSLKRHMKLHNTGRTITCKACNENFLNKELYQKHRMEIHIKLSGFFEICPECNEEFFTYREYYYHMSVHKTNKNIKKRRKRLNVVKEGIQLPSTGNMEIICWLCGEVVLSKLFAEHKNIHLLMTSKEMLECVESKRFPCKRCDNIYSTKKSLLNHIGSHMEKIYACTRESCTQHLFTYKDLKRHERTFHAVSKVPGFQKSRAHRHSKNYTVNKLKKKIFTCAWCSAKFYNPIAITQHYKTHKTPDFRCRICNKRYPIAQNIKTHMWKVHRQNFSIEDCYRYLVNKTDATEEAYVCDWCKVGFPTQIALTMHAQMHTVDRYQCKSCKTCFTEYVKYATHIKNNVCIRWVVEALVPEAKYLKCIFCNELFSEYFYITKHITDKHLKELYQCKFCDSSYPLDLIRSHLIKRHSRRRKYLCVGCQASFITFRAYLQHRRCCVECLLVYQCSRPGEHLNESNIVIQDNSVQEDIIDIPEKVVVNEFGDVMH